jgi:hypothetical protein
VLDDKGDKVVLVGRKGTPADEPGQRVGRSVAVQAHERAYECPESVAAAGVQLEAVLTALIDSAGITPADRALVRAMIDLGTWQALRDHGLGPAEAVDAVSRILRAV